MATGIATATTRSVRVPQLLAGTLTRVESTRMVAGKAAARIAAKRPARPAPHRALHDAPDVAEAATRPARRRVKADAARLSKG